ncbi:hypothetical protein CDL15_Pgr010772 [Punica granatum]|uniref:MLO-like protein n=1 Tax=Punica granatum TaxID=22663 RepID=A0A218W4N1_PUNGR|nr:hypothetical protein CDL15_Pgr010772 [Punica granatum]
MAVAGETTLEHTPTWVVAAVCSVIVAISLGVERLLHYTGKAIHFSPPYSSPYSLYICAVFVSCLYLKKKGQKPLFEALLKIKEESPPFASLRKHPKNGFLASSKKTLLPPLPIFRPSFLLLGHLVGSLRKLLLVPPLTGMVPLLSATALHHLHIFIFVLAVTHVIICVLTILFGGAKIRQWRIWEDAIQKSESNPEDELKKFTHVQDHAFIRNRFLGIGKDLALLGWVHSFFKQFYASVTRSDYITLRLGFIMTHCRGNPKFNFHKYMIRALEADFKRVVGISWYLWIFVVVFLSLNVAVGTKLEHVINQLAHEVAEKHVAIEGDLVVQPSDNHFWFHRPKIVLYLIHIILFQNAFELAFFFFILVQYKFKSCIMGPIGYIIPRLVIGAFVQFLCSYSTLPLYAIVTQMGSSFKKAIFDEHIQEGITVWAQHARKNQMLKKAANASSHTNNNSQAGTKEAEMVLVDKDKEEAEGSQTRN